MAATRETLIAALNAAYESYATAKTVRLNTPVPREILSDRSAKAAYLWASRRMGHEIRRRELDLRAARAALRAAGFSDDE